MAAHIRPHDGLQRDMSHAWPDQPVTSGIYSVAHLPSGRSYIGSSLNVFQRLRSHRGELRRGKHAIKDLQAAWTRDGEEAFTFHVLQLCWSPEMLLACEQFYLDARPDAFNRTRVVIAPSQDPAVAGKIKVAVAVAFATPSYKANQSAAQRRSWADQEIRERRVAGLRKAASRPDYRQHRAAASRTQWARQKAEGWCPQRTLEARVRFGEASRIRWANPEWRATTVAAQKAARRARASRGR